MPTNIDKKLKTIEKHQNPPYRPGIENLPLRQVNTDCPILVIVTDLATDDIVQTIEMNYADVEDRKHLGRLTFWAVSNKHSIETMAKADADLAPIEDKND